MKKKLTVLAFFSLLGFYVISNAANLASLVPTSQTAYPVTPSRINPTTMVESEATPRKGVAWSTIRFTLDASSNCIVDNLSGLIWVRDLNAVNGGEPLEWDAALKVASNGKWCGYSDWRVPSINELTSLVNYNQSNPANWLMYGGGDSGSPDCNGACFANVQSIFNYWSSSSISPSTPYVWTITMGDGTIRVSGKSNSRFNQLLPVRGGQ